MLNKLLEQAASVAIGGHVRPDGDCVGSCIGLYQYIKAYYPEKITDVYLEEIPNCFRFLKGTDEIRHEAEAGKCYDLFIVLDCGDEERLGFSGPLFASAGRTFCVDHHISNQAFADVNHIDPDASSTSELVYRMLNSDRITLEMAEAFYMGIVHDTGVFQYACAGPETFETAAQLLRKGVDAPALIDRTYYEKTFAQNQIMGQCLLNSMLILDNTCIVASVTQREMEFFGVKPKDLEGIVSQLRVTRGTEVAMFLYELDPNVYKVSLRSKRSVDVSRIAQFFGGGGHVRAAGCTIQGSCRHIISSLAAQIEKQLEAVKVRTDNQ